MPENPEQLNFKVDKTGHSDGSLASLRKEIDMHRHHDENKSVLDKLVQSVYNPGGRSLAALTDLEALAREKQSRDGDAALAAMRPELSQAIESDKAAIKTQNEVNFYAGSALKAIPLFAGPKSRFMLATSVTLNALDAVHQKDSTAEATANLALGGLKGLALKETFDRLGSKSFSLAPEGQAGVVSKYLGIGAKGAALGTLSRVYETGLTASNYVDSSGKVSAHSLVDGTARTLATALDAKAMVMDGALFMGGHGIFSGMSKGVGMALEGNATAEALKASSVGKFLSESRLLPNAGMGATFGFSSGATGEFMRQREQGQGYDIGNIIKRGAYQSLADGAAGATGSTFMHMAATSARVPLERNDNRRFAGADSDQNIAGDGTGSDLKGAVNPESGSRVVQIEVKPEQKPIFDATAHLAAKAVDVGGTAKDVVAFYEQAASVGRDVKIPMLQLADMARDSGHVPMERMVRQGYEATPEVVAQVKQGLDLAQQAVRPAAGPEAMRDFMHFAYGEGRSPQVEGMLRMAAEIAEEHPVNRALQEAYAGVNNLRRQTSGMTPPTEYIPPEVKESFRSTLKMPVENADQHIAFRQAMHDWIERNPMHEFLAKSYGAQTGNGLHAAVIDAKLGTDYLSQFPGRYVSTPNLLEQLGARHQAADVPQDNRLPGTGPQAQEVKQPVTPADRPAGPDQPIYHQDGRLVVNTDLLFKRFQSASGVAQHDDAIRLSYKLGELSGDQFKQWLDYAYQPANRPGMHPDVNNLALMNITGGRVLNRPEVRQALYDPDHSPIALETVQRFLAERQRTEPNLTAPELDFIQQRMRLSQDNLQAMGQPSDPVSVLKDALPTSYLRALRERYSEPLNDGSGRYSYPAAFDVNLASALEAHRVAEASGPKYKPPWPRDIKVERRMELLDKALEIQKVTSRPRLVNDILRLAPENQPAVENIFKKLDPTQAGAHWTELLNIVVPKAKSIYDIKTVLEATQAAADARFKADKPPRAGQPPQDNSFHLRMKEANGSLAVAEINRLVPPSDPGWQKAQDIIAKIIAGDLKDPRPGFDGGPGRSPGGKPGEFRGRPGSAPDRVGRGQDLNRDRRADSDAAAGSNRQQSAVLSAPPVEPVQPAQPVQPVQPVESAQAQESLQPATDAAPDSKQTLQAIVVQEPHREAAVVLEDATGKPEAVVDGLPLVGADGAGINTHLVADVQRLDLTAAAPEPVVNDERGIADEPVQDAAPVAQDDTPVQPAVTAANSSAAIVPELEGSDSGRYGGKSQKKTRGRPVVVDEDDEFGDYEPGGRKKQGHRDRGNRRRNQDEWG